MILGGDSGTAEAGSCSVPPPPFPGTHVCSHKRRHRHAHAFSWLLRRSQCSCVSQAEPVAAAGGRACLAVRDGVWGRSTPGVLLWRVRGGAGGPVRMRLCVAKRGANVTVLEKDSPAWDVLSSLPGSQVGLAPHLHPRALCYVQKIHMPFLRTRLEPPWCHTALLTEAHFAAC